MKEDELLARWERDRPIYERWGQHVVAVVCKELVSSLNIHSIDVFLRVPARARLKEGGSLVEKALYIKTYSDPYADLTDKVGARFVVLLNRDIQKVMDVIERCPDWTASRDRDDDAERMKRPWYFGYQSVHYVVRASSDLEIDGVKIPKETPCEVQIRTLLQHAHSELTHPTIYKPRTKATPSMERAAATSMALIEAAGDFFEKVYEEFKTSTDAVRSLSDDLAVIYRERVGRAAERTRIEGMLLELNDEFRDEHVLRDLKKFLDEKPFVAERVRDKATSKLLFRQPSILLVYFWATKHREQLKELWPLTEAELRPVYSDLGIRL